MKSTFLAASLSVATFNWYVVAPLSMFCIVPFTVKFAVELGATVWDLTFKFSPEDEQDSSLSLVHLYTLISLNTFAISTFSVDLFLNVPLNSISSILKAFGVETWSERTLVNGEFTERDSEIGDLAVLLITILPAWISNSLKYLGSTVFTPIGRLVPLSFAWMSPVFLR